MKNMKKFLTGLTAALCSAALLSAHVPMSASAIIYGDINNSGNVNLSDVVSFNKYLAGKVVLYNYEVADLNTDMVIDVIDVLILQDFVVHKILELPYVENNNN